MRRSVLAAAVAMALLLTAALPTAAPLAAEAEDPWVAWVSSEGTHGVSRWSELNVDSHQAGFAHCYILAPLEEACIIHGNSTWPAPGGTWLSGFFPPTIRPGIVPYPFPNGGYGQGGAFVGAAEYQLTGTANTAKVLGHCIFAEAAYRGAYLGPGFPPFFWCDWEFIYGGSLFPSGYLTADFQVSLYDPSRDPINGDLFPSTAGMDGAVGTMHGFLFAR